MNDIKIKIICILIGYVCGLFQTSYIYGKLHGIDIRTMGSGNAGSTNAMRVFGKKIGIMTAFCDVLKCIIAVLIVGHLFGKAHSDILLLLRIYTGAGVVFGHNFPFYMGFKGGKGIAATGGMIIAFNDPPLTAIGVVCMLAGLLGTKYMSVGSLLMSGSFMIGIVVRGQMGAYNMTQSQLIEMYIIVAILISMAYYKHRGNIQRLIHGTERKTYLIGKPKE